MRGVFWARRRLVRKVQLCILPNAERAKRFLEETRIDRKVFSVWNCPSQKEVAAPRPLGSEKILRLAYCGTVNPDRLPQTLLCAMAKFPGEIQLNVVGYETEGSCGYMQEFQKVAAQLGISKQVKFFGALSRKPMFDCLSLCHVGLALLPIQTANMNFRFIIGASNKAFDYLALGLALLVPDLPGWRECYVNPGYGVSCDPGDPESLKQTFKWFLEHPSQRHAMGERGRQRIQAEWNYERQFRPIFLKLNEMTE